ncbi:uncharacterized protein [Antedon mediterranea]|uniref:uncharacterized protein isoform X2 n=1 Tax=Antedon mediterranea TaxID=105859 RepID=UPI003AF6B0EE
MFPEPLLYCFLCHIMSIGILFYTFTTLQRNCCIGKTLWHSKTKMYARALALLSIPCIFASTVVTPPFNQYVKYNLQLICTDDDRDSTQPEWISPSNTKIDTFKSPGANCDNTAACNAEFGHYCENAFADCVDGHCICQQFGIDPCSCLVSLNDCSMVRGNDGTISVATSVNTEPIQYTSCRSETSAVTEVYIIAMVYGIASPSFTNVNVNILNRNNRTDKEIVIVLVSDRLVFWRVNINNNETIHRLVHLSRYQDENNFEIHGQVTAIHKPKGAPYGIGDDAIYGGKTVDMLLYLKENYVVFTENVFPWKTKLTIVGLREPKDYGNYTCRGKNSQSNVQIIKKESTVVEAPHRQNLNFGEDGIIMCNVTGIPKPTVSWTFNGNLISESEQYTILSEGSLKITKVDKDDSGTYECRGVQSENDPSCEETIQVTLTQYTNCDNTAACNAEFGHYCENAFADCVDGHCICQQLGIDPCSCLERSIKQVDINTPTKLVKVKCSAKLCFRKCVVLNIDSFPFKGYNTTRFLFTNCTQATNRTFKCSGFKCYNSDIYSNIPVTIKFQSNVCTSIWFDRKTQTQGPNIFVRVSGGQNKLNGTKNTISNVIQKNQSNGTTDNNESNDTRKNN